MRITPKRGSKVEKRRTPLNTDTAIVTARKQQLTISQSPPLPKTENMRAQRLKASEHIEYIMSAALWLAHLT